MSMKKIDNLGIPKTQESGIAIVLNALQGANLNKNKNNWNKRVRINEEAL